MYSTLIDIGVIFDPSQPDPPIQIYDRAGYTSRDEAIARCRELNEIWKEYPWCHFTPLVRNFTPIPPVPFEGISLVGAEDQWEEPGSDPYDLFSPEECARIEQQDDDDDGGEIDVSSHPF